MALGRWSTPTPAFYETGGLVLEGLDFEMADNVFALFCPFLPASGTNQKMHIVMVGSRVRVTLPDFSRNGTETASLSVQH